MQVKAQNLEKEEQEKHMQTRQKKIVSIESQLIKNQQIEMQGTTKKLETIQTEQLRQREIEQNK